MVKVSLHVYDLADNSMTDFMGLGAYHSGIEIKGLEYTFGPSGIFSHTPQKYSDAKFKEKIELGDADINNVSEINNIISDLKKDFPSSSYDVIKKNCNHFAQEFANKLIPNVQIPSWINRSSYIGSFVPFLFKKETVQSFQQQETKIEEKVTIEISQTEILNSKSNTQDLYKKDSFIQSYTDHQLLIFVSFKKNVNLNSMEFTTKGDQTGPKSIKLYVNKLNLDFENVSNISPSEEFIVENQKEVKLVLKKAKMRNVSSISIFIDTNYGDKITKISNLKFL